MPNWTDNLLVIDGPIENVKTFFTELKAVNDNLTELFPIPEAIKKLHQGSRTIDGVQVDAWYDDEDGVRPLMDITKEELIKKHGTYKPIEWQYENWGTKWGDCETEVFTNNEGKKIITFQSAWGPPWKLLNNIAEKYDITIIDNVQYEFEEGIHIDKYPLEKTSVDANNKAWDTTKKILDSM